MNLLQHSLRISNVPSAIVSWIVRRLRGASIRNGPKCTDTEEELTVGEGKTSQDSEAERKQREVHDVRHQLEAERASLEQQRKELEATLAETSQLQVRLVQLESSSGQEAEQLRELVDRERTARIRSEARGEDASTEVQRLRERLDQREGEARRSAARIDELERMNAQVEKERRSAAALLQARTAELREAQSFLVKEDDVDDSEVVHLVETLNGQIGRTADRLAHGPYFRFGSSGDVVVVQKATKRLERYAWIPPSLISALRSADRGKDADMVRTSLQAGMAMYTRWLATSWDLGVLDSRGLLEGIYLSIRERGKWRALCRTHVKSLLDTGEAQTRRLFETLSIIVSDVLIICGAEGTWDSISGIVVHEFERELLEVVDLALRFQWTVGERVLLRDFVVFVADSDATYDHTRMEDGNASLTDPSSEATLGRVLCTTHLGLMSESTVAANENRHGRKSGTKIVLKARVVLNTDVPDTSD
ncbi:hypothetical protein GSI_03382 [Ganoderma sinense ZZ0214-1]|uniref:Uncharacterized protein n=1 Tax=Ganoderma sinense ZZ0214-1 TaxID=1077348 RepID=A0A2G8SLJ8_9APHY|nr:hypothetical protein GSI_03382 [Ganoderma sinense ZZ0214-1]